MAKRLLDLVCASVALVLAAPVLLLAAIGIRLTSPGPVFYRAQRVGRMGRPFTMFKLRTMHVGASREGPPITGTDDPRVFPFGRFLRRSKIDELPQLLNVLLGHMSIVGPRPEDPAIVEQYYAPMHHHTLRVRPGLASPGSIYQFTHGDELLDGVDPEAGYVDRLLDIKLALDLAMLRRASLRYDLSIIGRTFYVIAAALLGRRHFPPPPEMSEAHRILRSDGGMSGGLRTAAQVAILAFAVLTAATCKDPTPPVTPSSPPPPPPPPALMVGAGDIANCNDPARPSSFRDDSTALLLDSIVAANPAAIVYTLGDNAYPDGTLEQYEQCYGPTWGRHKARTRPALGNHDWNYATGSAAGYFSYFGDAGMGPGGKGYYSYDAGSWHVVVLDSAEPHYEGKFAQSQIQWLRDDLSASTARCTLAYWHHPYFSSGLNHGNDPDAKPVWDVLYAHGVDVVLVGHEHNYERFAPQTPTGTRDDTWGIRQFLVGSGGESNYPVDTLGRRANSEVFETRAPGVLALTLWPDRYEWRFVSLKGRNFADTGSGTCHDAPLTGSAMWWLVNGWAVR